jgi:membrane peptidoglycan carboxypeptidase
MVGFTPKVSAAVWVGTDKPQAITTVQGNQIYGRTLPGETWQKFMNGYLAGTPGDQLTDQVEVNAALRPAPQITARQAPPSPSPSPTPSPTPRPRKTRPHRPTPSPTPSATDPSPTPSATDPTATGTPSPKPTRTKPGPPLPTGITP